MTPEPENANNQPSPQPNRGPAPAADAQQRKRGAATDGDEPTAVAKSAASDSPSFDPSSFTGGGGPSNTPPQKTTHPKKPIPGGEDWLSVNFYVNHLNFAATAHVLDQAQLAAQAGRTGDDEVQLGEVRCIVHAHGAKQGGGLKAQHMRWRLQTEQGLTLLIMNRAEAHVTQPNVSATATSLMLMRHGFETVWGLMQYVVEQLGCEIVRNKLSRVDPRIDLPEIPVGMFADPFRCDWFVTRAKGSGKYAQTESVGEYSSSKRSTGFTVGKHPLILRVYDKLKESQRDLLKLAVLKAQRWDGLPRAATRIEIELGRKKLKQKGIDTVEDWIAKRGDLINLIMRDWFRLTEEPVDRQHANRAKTHPLWEMARTQFSKCYGEPIGYDLSPLPPLEIDTRQRVAGAVGIFKGLFARTSLEIADNEHFLREVETEIRNHIQDRDMAAEVRRKAIELGVEGL